MNILITGASSGLGAALAVAYAAPGYTLLLTGRNKERLQQVAETCRTHGAVVIAEVLDVTNAAALAQWIKQCDHEHPIDLLIANAGISGGTFGGGETDEQTRTIFAVNVEGVLNTVLPTIPLMQARQKGHIVLISSLAGFRGLPSAPSYSASKAAVRLYGEGLRGSLAKDKIAVTVVTPGYIKTPMTAVNNFPMPLLMSAEKAARLIKCRLAKAPARIAFPWLFYALVHFIACLPPRLTDPLLARLPAKPSVSYETDA